MTQAPCNLNCNAEAASGSHAYTNVHIHANIHAVCAHMHTHVPSLHTLPLFLLYALSLQSPSIIWAPFCPSQAHKQHGGPWPGAAPAASSCRRHQAKYNLTLRSPGRSGDSPAGGGRAHCSPSLLPQCDFGPQEGSRQPPGPSNRLRRSPSWLAPAWDSCGCFYKAICHYS